MGSRASSASVAGDAENLVAVLRQSVGSHWESAARVILLHVKHSSRILLVLPGIEHSHPSKQ